MSSFINELKKTVRFADTIELSDELKNRLGPRAKEAEENSRYVDAFVFHYESAGNLVTGFCVAPKHIEKELPAIIFNRGGTKNFGLVLRGHLFTKMAEMARWGYVVIGSQYPGNYLSTGKDEWGGKDLDSVLDLHPILEKLPCVNAKRIGMLGESRGGMMTYLSIKHTNWIKAAVTVAGTSDLISNAKMRPAMQQVFDEAFGGTKEEKVRRSAVYWNEFLKDTPLLLHHGTADERVNFEDTVRLVKKLKMHNHKDIDFVYYKDGDHGLTQYSVEVKAKTKDWFKKYL